MIELLLFFLLNPYLFIMLGILDREFQIIMAQRYIPGLTSRDLPTSQELQDANIPKNVPTELIESFQNGTKQVFHHIFYSPF